MYPPKKNTAFTLYFTLFKNDGTIIANPGTITKKYSIDGAAVADITAAITEEDTTYGQCSVVLAAGEMNGDAVWVYIKDDTAGCVPFICTLYTAAQTLDEVYSRLGAPAGASMSADIAAIEAQTDDIGAAGAGLTAVPWNAAWDAEVQSEVADALAVYDPPTKAELDTAQGAVTLANGAHGGAAATLTLGGAGGLTGAVTGSLSGSVGSVTGAVGSVTGAVGSVAAGGIAAASFAANALTASALATDAVAEIADGVWDEAIAGHLGAGSTGNALNAAGSAGDPWATAIPGAYGAGTAGLLLGTTIPNAIDAIDNYVDTEVGALTTELAKVPKSDSTVTWNATALASIQQEATDALNAYDPPTNAELEARTLIAASYFDPAADTVAHVTLVDTTTTNTDMVAAAPAASAIADAVLDEAMAGHVAAGSLGKAVADVLADTGTDGVVVGAASVTAIQNGLATPTNITAGTITTVTNLTNAPTAGDLTATMKASVTAAVPTAVANADALLGRNIAGGSSVGRTVKQALRLLRNKVTSSGGTLTIYQEDDVTSDWTAALTEDAAANPIVTIDPA